MSVYLIDIKSTLYIKNNLFLDDLLEDYDNPSIYIYKNIPSGTVQVTADFVDVAGKIIAYLIQNNEYIIEVHSDNKPTRIMGNYGATDSGDQNIRLYDVNIPTQATGAKNNLYTTIYKSNESNTIYAVGTYSDEDNTTTAVTFQVRKDSEIGPILYSRTYYNNSNIVFMYNITNNLNDTLYGRLLYTYLQDDVYGSNDESRLINYQEGWNKPEFNQDFMNWVITIVLSMLAIFSTIKSANLISLVLLAFAALLVSVKFYTLSWGVIAVAALVSLLKFLKKGEKEL
jgi:hypothetical protein